MKGFFLTNDIIPNNVFSERFCEMLEYRNQDLHIQDYNGPFQDAILDSLPVNPISTCFFTEGLLDPYSCVTKLLDNELALVFLSFKCPPTPSFEECFQSIHLKRKATMLALSFTESSLTSAELEHIYVAAMDLSLQSLEFHNSIQDSSMPYFYRNFLNRPLFESVIQLNLDGTKNLNLKQFLPQIADLSILSIANCDIEIYDILSNLDKVRCLRVLNISGNRCTHLSPFKLPNLLRSIIATNIDWSASGTFPLYIATLFSQNSENLKLAFDDAIVPTDDMIWTFDVFEQSLFTGITSFSWSHLPVSEYLFNFLLKQDRLESISFSGCFKKNPVRQIIEYLDSAPPTLRRIYLRQTQFGDQLENFFNACLRFPSLIAIDISESSTNAFDCIPNFLQITNAKTLMLDGLYPDEAYQEIISLMKVASKSRCVLSFPHNDLHRMKYNDMISQEQYAECRNMVKKVDKPAKPVNNARYPPVKESLLEHCKFYVPYFRQRHFISHYISPKEAEAFKQVPNILIDSDFTPPEVTLPPKPSTKTQTKPAEKQKVKKVVKKKIVKRVVASPPLTSRVEKKEIDTKQPNTSRVSKKTIVKKKQMTKKKVAKKSQPVDQKESPKQIASSDTWVRQKRRNAKAKPAISIPPQPQPKIKRIEAPKDYPESPIPKNSSINLYEDLVESPPEIQDDDKIELLESDSSDSKRSHGKIELLPVDSPTKPKKKRRPVKKKPQMKKK